MTAGLLHFREGPRRRRPAAAFRPSAETGGALAQALVRPSGRT